MATCKTVAFVARSLSAPLTGLDRTTTTSVRIDRFRVLARFGPGAR